MANHDSWKQPGDPIVDIKEFLAQQKARGYHEAPPVLTRGQLAILEKALGAKAVFETIEPNHSTDGIGHVAAKAQLMKRWTR
jgi:hypothetical protein